MEQQNKDLKVEKQKVVYPQIPPQAWFEASRHTLETNAQDQLLDDDMIAINCYTALLHFGHRDYCTKKEAIALGVALLKLLAPEKLKQ